jgi:hypothetical protein
MEFASPAKTEIYLNAFDKTIQVNGVSKTFDDEFWIQNLVPILYPIWDSDKDKLETFVKYKDGTARMNKTKYSRSQKTGEYKWISYQFDISVFPQHEIDELVQALYDKFTLYRVNQENDLERALAGQFAKSAILNWNKIVLIRNFLLSDCDWTQTNDAPLSDNEKEMWKSYRQKLREIPQSQNNIPASEVKFPITPRKYKNLETEVEYLSDEYDHFYRMNQLVYSKFADRIVNYLAIAISTQAIEEMPVRNVYRPNTGDKSLDQILEMIEEGEL